MQGLNYTRLNSISNSVSPYRGSVNRFPIGSRRHNTKYFLVREEDGQRVFDIVHGQRWKHITLTKTEHDNLAKQGSPKLRSYQHGDGTWEYYTYEVSPNILGVVRPDNTFEFTSTSYGQGDRGILSTYGHGELSTNSRMGGMIWTGRLMVMGLVVHIRSIKACVSTVKVCNQPSQSQSLVGRSIARWVKTYWLATQTST
jgi:hypothetical protein